MFDYRIERYSNVKGGRAKILKKATEKTNLNSEAIH